MNPETRAAFDEVFRASKEHAITTAVLKMVIIEAGLMTEEDFNSLRAKMSAAMDQAIAENRFAMPEVR